MEIRPEDLDPGTMHKLLIGCVVPRPIAWVSSQDATGHVNLAPYSFFNALSSRPAMVMISASYNANHPTGRKDTLRNILATGEFVVNIVNEAAAEAMNQTATLYPDDVDEFAEVGITPVPSTIVRPPRVAESPINFECRLHTTVPLGEGPGSATLVIGQVQYLHVQDDLIDDHYRVDIHQLRPVGRLAGNSYCSVRDVFELERKPYEPAT
jgi:flavin reductase (DIM6/NTAB) family NADH-FMN oxidoreductase RutF